jgi:hypothetical protein
MTTTFVQFTTGQTVNTVTLNCNKLMARNFVIARNPSAKISVLVERFIKD